MYDIYTFYAKDNITIFVIRLNTLCVIVKFQIDNKTENKI